MIFRAVGQCASRSFSKDRPEDWTMAKMRHISYRAEDVDAMAKFFVDALGLTMVQKRKDNSIDLSDGSINISILALAANRSRRAGLDHIGFSAGGQPGTNPPGGGSRRGERADAFALRRKIQRSGRDHCRRWPLARRGAGEKRVTGAGKLAPEILSSPGQ